MFTGSSAALDVQHSPMTEFEMIAAAAGHDFGALSAGGIATAHLRISDIHSLRRWMSHAGGTERRLRQRSFAGLGGRTRLWQGVHDRGEAYIFAGTPLEASDIERMGEHFPARLKVVSARDVKLGPGAVLDVSATADEWNVGTREELYTLLNIGSLTLDRGARIVVRGNVFSMLVQQLDILPGHADEEIGAVSHHIAILPTPHPVDSGISGPLDGPAGFPGRDGLPGRDGRSVKLRASVFGPAIVDVVPFDECSGGDGGNGTDGGRGRRGRTGGMCKTAEITIRSFASTSDRLSVFCQAGRGGDGGAGGKGGDGGRGGNGGRGGADVNESRYGPPGLGGRGGKGGRGGNGGNGGISSNVFISCPPAKAHLITVEALESEGGRCGSGGGGGRGGAPGESKEGISSVLPGLPGPSGEPGLPGRGRPSARVHVNEILKS
ncbi:hypothetical protein [Sinorhizobium arboris]|uniref:hypothetical protein n=1 Tax=Sinorhizobium arboris TaxID=76745 RepID=UPI0004049562|nr:hypothetical protein [Sinorhizobium arboris]